MMLTGLTRNLFVFLHAKPEFAQIRSALEDLLAKDGWTLAERTRNGVLHLAPGSAPPIQRLGPDGLLIGRYLGHTDTHRPSSAHTLVRSGWGMYLALWDLDEDLTVFRDPSGGVDAAVWSYGPVTIVAPDVPPALDRLLPRHAELNWTSIAALIRAPAVSHHLGLSGFDSIAPGRLMKADAPGRPTEPVWTPATFARQVRPADPAVVRRVVKGAVRYLLEPHSEVAGELSGGLDSSIVATAAQQAGARRIQWINFHAVELESDERRYVEAMASWLGTPVVSRAKRVQPLRMEQLRRLCEGIRPGLFGLDVEYDDEVAQFMQSANATAVVTGQGGDAVFFQTATPAVAIDRLRRCGLRTMTPRFLHQVALWTDRSVWSIAGMALRDRTGRPWSDTVDDPAARPEDHPWLADLQGLPPGKVEQIRQLVNSQVFLTPSLRGRAGEVLHPLLSQPVMEHLLRIPTDELTRGGLGRALAREAFRHQLPDCVRRRGSKGELTTYYGHVVRESLPLLRELLLDGVLVHEGLLDRNETERLLNPDLLISSGDYNVALVRTLIEVWCRAWLERLSGVRTSKSLI